MSSPRPRPRSGVSSFGPVAADVRRQSIWHKSPALPPPHIGGYNLQTRAEASILVGVLWCLALLSIIVIGLLHTARIDLLVGKHHTDRIQPHYLALASIEKAKAQLYQNARERSRAGQSQPE